LNYGKLHENAFIDLSNKGGIMSDAYLGEIRMFGGTFAPSGWALCNGQLLPISQNNALFSILGTSFGGDGVSTFGLPNLQSRVPVHQGQGQGLSPYTVGQTGGSEQVTLLANQMPVHTHIVNASNTNASATTAGGNLPATVDPPRGQEAPKIYGSPAATTMAANMIGSAGGSQPHTNIQPYQCVTFIIALQGIYPSRG
jgi:microcystin-dependent protein